MSFTLQPNPPARPNRCQLFGPGSRPAIFEKMAASAADVINLDLEDAVAPQDKPQARLNIIAAVNDIDWGAKTLSLRINGLDTHYMYRDVVDVIEVDHPSRKIDLVARGGFTLRPGDLLLVQDDPYRDDYLELPLDEIDKRRANVAFSVRADNVSKRHFCFYAQVVDQ